MTVAKEQRLALVDALIVAGPDAPTLDEGWDARMLAAHIILREGYPRKAVGIFNEKKAAEAEAVQHEIAAKPWDEIVDLVASGPPKTSPFFVLDAVANPFEFFVHTEDVRRAQKGWLPRPLDAKTERTLWRTAKLFSKRTLRNLDDTVVLAPDNAASLTIGDPHRPAVTLRGRASELALWVAGRDEVDLRIEGDADAIDRVLLCSREV